VQAITYLRATRGPHLVTLMANKELNTETDVLSRDLRGGSEVQSPKGIPLSPLVSLGFILFQCGGHTIHGTENDVHAIRFLAMQVSYNVNVVTFHYRN